MLIREVYIWSTAIFISYLIILIAFNVTGPDYVSYTNAADLSLFSNFFKSREIISWFIIDSFSKMNSSIEHFGLKIFLQYYFLFYFYLHTS